MQWIESGSDIQIQSYNDSGLDQILICKFRAKLGLLNESDLDRVNKSQILDPTSIQVLSKFDPLDIFFVWDHFRNRKYLRHLTLTLGMCCMLQYEQKST